VFRLRGVRVGLLCGYGMWGGGVCECWLVVGFVSVVVVGWGVGLVAWVLWFDVVGVGGGSGVCGLFGGCGFCLYGCGGGGGVWLVGCGFSYCWGWCLCGGGWGLGLW